MNAEMMALQSRLVKSMTEVTDVADERPLEIDLHKYEKIYYGPESFNYYRTHFISYKDGLAVRKQLGKTLDEATSVTLINLPDPFKEGNEWILVGSPFLAGLFGKYIREGCRPIRVPDWLKDTMESTAFDVLSGSTSDGLSMLYEQMTPFFGNPFYGIGGHKMENADSVFANYYDPSIALATAIEMMDKPPVLNKLYQMSCKFKSMLEDRLEQYLDKMREYLGSYKGRWIHITPITEEANSYRYGKKIDYNHKSIHVEAIIAKIGGPNETGHYKYECPIVSDPEYPVFFLGRANGDDTIKIYPVINDYIELPLFLSYCAGDKPVKPDSWGIVKEDVVTPKVLVEFASKGLLNPVYDKKNKTFYEYKIPEIKTESGQSNYNWRE